MPGKAAIQSMTLWGVFVTALSTVLPHLASSLNLTDPATQTAVMNLINGVGVFVGLVLTVYGRLNANQAISSLFKPKATAIPSTPETTAASSPPTLPPAALGIVLCLLAFGLMFSSMMTACSTVSSATSSPASLELNEGKALAASYQAADALAVALDDAAKAGQITGANATAARSALIDLQLGLSTADAAYAAGAPTAQGQIATLAKLLSSAASAIPLSGATATQVQTAISLAAALAIVVG